MVKQYSNICAICGLLFIICLLTSAEMFAAALPSQTPDKEISQVRDKMLRLQEGIIKQEKSIFKAEVTERTILEELEQLDKKLNEQRDKLKDLEIKMSDQQAKIDKEQKALLRIHAEKNIVQDHLKNRISAYYTMGDIGLLNVTFSTKTLPELLAFHDGFDTLIQYDKDVIKVYKETIQELERLKLTLGLEKSVLEEFIDQSKKEQVLLGKTKNKKSFLLTQVRTKAKLHKQAIWEMQAASQELAESLVAIKIKNEIFEQGFLSNKGSLPPPIDGTLITLFNQEKTNELGIAHQSLGIELKAPDGTQIIAVSDGDVVFSGYLRGYGNTIVIYHGYKYYTVTSRIEKILVKKGEKVGREQQIGLMGDSATLFAEGLYFEIRHDQDSLDPLLWLNPNRLTTSHETVNNHIGGMTKNFIN